MKRLSVVFVFVLGMLAFTPTVNARPTLHTYYHHYTRGAVFFEEEIVADETQTPCALFGHGTLGGGPSAYTCQADFENESLVEILD